MLKFFSFFAFGFFGVPTIFVILIGITLAVFEILMLIHAITNDKLENTNKVLWVIGMLLIHPFVAIAYYFFEYRKAK